MWLWSAVGKHWLLVPAASASNNKNNPENAAAIFPVTMCGALRHMASLLEKHQHSPRVLTLSRTHQLNCLHCWHQKKQLFRSFIHSLTLHTHLALIQQCEYTRGSWGLSRAINSVFKMAQRKGIQDKACLLTDWLFTISSSVRAQECLQHQIWAIVTSFPPLKSNNSQIQPGKKE